MYLPYDEKVDEKEGDHKYSVADVRYRSETYHSTHSKFFTKPPKTTCDSFGKQQFVSQEVYDSGFTRIPKFSITDNKADQPRFGASKALVPTSPNI
jgi:hypothetical protein